MGLGAVISGFLGSSGLGLLVKNEVDYKKEIANLEENSYVFYVEIKAEKNNAAQHGIIKPCGVK